MVLLLLGPPRISSESVPAATRDEVPTALLTGGIDCVPRDERTWLPIQDDWEYADGGKLRDGSKAGARG